MRQRSQLNPRELAREGRRRAGRMRAWSGGRPDQATVLVEERLSDGRYKVKRDNWPFSILVPASPPGVLIPVPRRMPLLFEGGNAQRPFLLWARARGGLLPIGEEATAVYTPWYRIGTRQDGRYWTATEGVLQVGPVPNPATWTSGSILRAWDGALGWASGSTYRERNLETGAITEHTHEGEIQSLWSDGGGCYAIVEAAAGSYESGFSDGYAAGRAVEYDGLNPYDLGGYHCESGQGYSPWPHSPLGSEYVPGAGSGTITPPSGNADYQTGWIAGLEQGWRDAYNDGYRASGCIPEE